MPVKEKKVEVENPNAKLMDNQDTENKGDSVGTKKVMITFWTTPEKKAELKEYAAAHGVTQTHVLIDGLNWALKQE